MRRLAKELTLVLVLSMALAATAAAAPPSGICEKNPNHPSCPPAPPPPAEMCTFDESGVLGNWDGTARYRCRWIVTDRTRDFAFQIQPASPTAVKVSIPHLIVTDVYPYGGDSCFNKHGGGGWLDLPYPADGEEEIWTFSLPADGNCVDDQYPQPDTDGPDSFAITVAVQKVKRGPVRLVWSNMNG
jgi:hypothetical protein